MHRDKNSLIDKVASLSKAKYGIHSPLCMGRQMFSPLQESRAPLCLVMAWEENTITLNNCT